MEEDHIAAKPFGLRAIDLLRKKVSAVLLALVLLLLVPYVLKYLNSQKPQLEMPSSQKPLSIKELIADLKTELGGLEKDREQNNESAAFDILGFDLEISFMVRASSGQKTGVEYQVVTADSEIQQGVEKIQKLTLHMKPKGERQLSNEPIAVPPENGVTSEILIDKPPPKKGTKP
jgi:hypothetical protein